MDYTSGQTTHPSIVGQYKLDLMDLKRQRQGEGQRPRHQGSEEEREGEREGGRERGGDRTLEVG